MPNYEMTGGLRARGHGPVRWTKNVRTKFRELDTAWSRYAAKKGKLEPVSIRTIILKSGYSVPGPEAYVIFYEDSLHGFWQEKDLLTHAEALETVQIYYDFVARDAYAGMLQS